MAVLLVGSVTVRATLRGAMIVSLGTAAHLFP